MANRIAASASLRDVKYEIRGQLANQAQQLEKRGYEIISLSIGNPGLFGFRSPETMRLAMIENLGQAEPYCHQKGIFPAREAVVMQQQERGIAGISAEEVFIGNGVSELIDLSLRALLNRGDEVLVPSASEIEALTASPYLDMQQPMGAMYAFIRLHQRFADKLDDRAFLPNPETINTVFDRIDALLGQAA